MAAVFIVDEGSTSSTGKNSTHEIIWQTVGYANNVARRSAITAHADYLASVTTADGVVLNNVEWHYSRQQKTTRKVRLVYSHQESKRNKSQNPPLQNVDDEETEVKSCNKSESAIGFSSIEIPITEAISQTKFADSPDIGNRIKYTPSTGEVEGTTRKRMVSRLVHSKIYDEATITNAWITGKEAYLFTVNNALFKGRPSDTVMFVGLDIKQRSKDGEYAVTFQFEHIPTESKDLTTLDIGSAEANQTIYPFRFYHALYEEEPDAGAKRLVPKCKGFYEAQIYERTNFNNIIS